MAFLGGTFLRQLLTVILSRSDMGRFVVWDKHVRVSTKTLGSSDTVERSATFEGLQ